MPNWCANSLKIKPKTKAAKTFMERKLLPELEKGKDSQIFNLISPMPQELINTVCGSVGEDKRDAHKAQMEANVEKFGYPTWYEYAHANWGTKWDASVYDYHTDVDGQLYISFDTAWGPPIVFYDKLGEMGYEVEAFYREEGMAFAGKYSDGCDDYYEYGSMSADEIRDQLPEELDDMFSISQYQRDVEQENRRDEWDEMCGELEKTEWYLLLVWRRNETRR